MSATPTPVEAMPSAWRRLVSWLEQWAEAFDFDISEHHERRISQLEREVAALHAGRIDTSDATASTQVNDRELS